MTSASKLIVHSPQGMRSLAPQPAAAPHVISELLRQAGLPLNTRCGQRGLCDGCFVELLSGTVVHAASGQTLEAAEHPLPIRGCEFQLAANRDAEIHVPARSLLAHEPQVVTSFRLNVSRAHDPLWQRVSCQDLSLRTEVAFAEALCEAVARQRDEDLPVRADDTLAALAGTPVSRLGVALEHRGDHWALLPIAGRSDRPVYGAAIDVGTTTVVVLLVDLANGEVVATASALNGQTNLGDNVLTRINLCLSEPAMVGRLQAAIAQHTLVPLLDQVLTEAGVSLAHLACLVFAGNTTMLHLLAGVDPTPLGTAPFTPVFLDHRVLPASALSLRSLSPAANSSAVAVASADAAQSETAAATLGDCRTGPCEAEACEAEACEAEACEAEACEAEACEAEACEAEACEAEACEAEACEAEACEAEACEAEACEAEACEAEACVTPPLPGGPEPEASTPSLRALTHLLPGAAAYVGADITAGVLSSGMAYRTDTCLLVDVGTNGEIVLKHGDRLLGCATAAGPAFEGAGLKCGVRAGRGAISHIRLEGDPRHPEIEVIGGDRPIGLCGTAYVDFIAQARQVGLIGPTGRYTAEALADGLVTQPAHARIFTVAYARGKEPLVVSEADIASLLQAKAAIAAGILCLLDCVGLQSRDVDTLYLAGGFGFHMDIENVIRCGLLPGFRREQIHLAGNTSLAGAYLALLDSGVLAEIKRVSARLEIVELNLDPHFESHYIDQLSLPDEVS